MRKWLRDPVAQTAETAETPSRRTVSEVSAVRAVSATPLFSENDPEAWLDMIRTVDLCGLSPERWAKAADALEGLIVSGAACRPLELGWDAHELVGVQRVVPHDAPHVAGLIFSMWPGDIVTDVRPSGAAIVYSGGRHFWLRRQLPLGADAVACLPWELPT